MVVAQDVGDSVGCDDGAQRSGHEFSGLRLRKLDPDGAAGPRGAQPLLASRHSRQIRAEPSSFDDVGYYASEISGDEVVGTDQVAWDLSLHIDPNAPGASGLAALDFASDADPDDVVIGVSPEHPAGRTSRSAYTRKQLLHRR